MSALPLADHELMNRPTRKIYLSSNGPHPTGELHHRVLRVTASPSAYSNLSRNGRRPDRCFALTILLRPTTGEAYHRVLRATASPGTTAATRPPSRRVRCRRAAAGGEVDFGGGKLDSHFFFLLFSFFSLLCLILLVAQAEGCYRARADRKTG